MNKVYKTVWNSSRGQWIAASELASSHATAGAGMPSSQRRLKPLIAALVACAGWGCAVPASAAPQSCTYNDTAPYTVICGEGAAASLDGSIAVGTNAKVTNVGAVNDTGGAAGVRGIAIGTNASTTMASSIAIGVGAIVQNTAASTSSPANAIAIGSGAAAMGSRSIAIGAGAGSTASNGFDNVVVGIQSGQNLQPVLAANNGGVAVSGSSNVAFGASSGNNVTGGSNAAFGIGAGNNVGPNTDTTRSNCVFLPGACYGGNLNGTNNLAIGGAAGNNVQGAINTGIGWKAGSNVNGFNNVGVGQLSGFSVTGSANVGIGDFGGAYVTGMGNTGVGNGSGGNVKGDSNSAFGNGAGNYVTGGGNLAMGPGSGSGTSTTALAVDRSTAIGNNAVGYGNDAIAMGTGAVAGVSGSATTVVNGVAIGNGAQATGINSAAMGRGANAAATSTLAIGNGAQALNYEGLAIGAGANASTSNRGIAIGSGATTSLTGGISMGWGANSGNVSALAFGTGAQATGINSISIGTGNIVKGANSGALGDPSVINGASSYSVGNNNHIGSTTTDAFALGNDVNLGADSSGNDTTSVTGAVALGSGSSVKQAGGVALGEGSVANTAAGVAGYNPAGGTAPAGATWNSTLAAVSVGSAGNTRQITNVAAGAQATDAVNVAQLQAAQAAASTHYYSVNDGGTTGGNYANDGATATNALAAGVGASATGASAAAVGAGAQALAPKAVAVGYGAVANADTSFALGSNSETLGANETSIGTFAGLTSAAAQAAGTAAYGAGNRQGQVNVGANAGRDVAGYNGVYIGGSAGQASTGVANTAVGVAAGRSSIGDSNTAIGDHAGNNVRGDGNVAIGLGAGSYLGVPTPLTKVDHTVAVGSGSRAGENESIAIGNNSAANGQSSIAQGDGAVAGVFGSPVIASDIALGTGAQAIGGNSIAVGTGNVVSGAGSGAFGGPNTVSGVSSYAFGNSNTIGANNAFVLGNNVTIGTGLDGAVALGSGSSVTQAGGVAVGQGSVADTAAGVAGYNPAGGAAPAGAAWNSTLAAVSVGSAGNTRQITNVAAGTQATDAVNVAQLQAAQAMATTHYYSVNDGGTAGANFLNDGAKGKNSLAAGVGASTTGDSSIAIGNGANISDTMRPASQQPTNSIAIGTNATVAPFVPNLNQYVDNAIAIGTNAKASRQQNIVIGMNASDAGYQGTVIGSGAGQGATTLPRAVGGQYGDITLLGMNAGNGATLGQLDMYLGDHAGAGAAADTVGANTAVGGSALRNMKGDFNTAIGFDAGDGITADSTVSIGASSKAVNDHDVALGADSITDAQHAGSFLIAGATGAAAGLNSGAAVVSVGTAGAERQIQNVAPGVLSTTSTDAINGSQLYATNQAIGALGGSPLTFAGDSGGGVARKLGQTLNITGGATGPLTSGNIGVVGNGTDTLQVQLAQNVNLGASGSVQIGNSTLNNAGLAVDDGTHSTSYGASGMAITGGPSMTTAGIDAGGQQITHVASGGTTATNAANIGDVQAAVAGAAYGAQQAAPVVYTDAAGTKLAKANDGKWYPASAVKPDGTLIGTPTAVPSASVIASMQSASGSATTPTVLANVANGNIAAGSHDAVNGSQLNATNQTVGNLGGSIATGLGGSSSYDAATGTLTTGLDVGGTTYNSVQNALNAVGSTAGAGWNVTTSAAAGTSGVANGSSVANVAPGATHTIQAGNNIITTQNGTSVEIGVNPNLTNLSSVSIAGGPTLNGGGIDMNNTKISNLAPGTAASDAATVGQVNAAGDKWSTGNPTTYTAPQATGTNSFASGSGAVASGQNSVALGNGSVATRSDAVSVGAPGSERQITNVAPGTAGTDAVNVNQMAGAAQQAQANAQNYTDQRVNGIYSALSDIGKRADAGVAGAMAMASLPQPYRPGQSMVGAALGGYHGQAGIAIGVSTITDSGNWVFKANVSGNTQGNVGVGVGAGFVW